MLIEFNLENITYEESTDPLFVPTFEITFLGRNILNDNIFGKLYGDVANFQALNDASLYIVHDKIPANNIEFFIDQKFKQPNSINEILKYKCRTKIENQIGDNEDLISDLTKRLVLNERLLVFLVNDILTNNNTMIPTVETKYKTLIDSYLAYHDVYNYKTSLVDIEDYTILFNKLLNRSKLITDIVEKEYINKKI